MHNVNFTGKLEKFSGNLFIQNDSVKCRDLSNRTEISIDCRLAGVRLQNLGMLKGQLQRFHKVDF